MIRRRTRLAAEVLETRDVPATLDAFLTDQHVDLTLGYSSGDWSFTVLDGDTPQNLAPDRALLYAGVNTLLSRPASSQFDFLGMAAGGDVYILPQTQEANQLFLGFAGYGIAGTALDEYDATTESKGRALGEDRWAKLTVTEVVGPGAFSIFQTGSFGEPIVAVSTFNDGVANPNGNGLDVTDGLTADDAVYVMPGSHAHYNFGFSAVGRYEVTLRASAYLENGNPATPGTTTATEEFTLYFSVANVGQFVIEPMNVNVNEGAGTATVTVERTGGSDGRVTVNYTTSNGTAIVGSDYTATSGTLTFNDLDTVKTFQVPITDDMIVGEPNETVNLTLSSPAPTSIAGFAAGLPGGSLLGTPSTGTLTILDNDDSNLPTITAIADLSTPEDTAVAVNFTIGDDDGIAGLIVTATSSNTALVPNTAIALALAPANGSSVAVRTLTVTPAAGQTGNTTITVTVTDGGGAQTIEIFLLTVTAGSNLPTISPIADQSTPENTPIGVPFTVGDDDGIAGLTIAVTSSNSALVPNTLAALAVSPANGSGVAARTLTVTPAANQSGSTTITVTVTDGGGAQTIEMFLLTVTSVTVLPTATNDTYGVTPGNVLRGNVLLNDTGGPLTAAVVTGPTGGTLLLNPNGTFTYTPEGTFTGSDSFTYQATGSNGSAEATATITGRPTEPTFEAILSEGHADIGIAYEDDAFDPHIHDGETDTEYASDEALLLAPSSTAVPRPAGAAFDFIGVPAGQTIWVLPQIEEVGKLFLGIGSEEIPPADFTGDLTLQILAVDGPGLVSMWQTDAFGGVIPLSATSDGITTGDAIVFPPGDHFHTNYGFTARGLYAVTLQFSGTPSSGANAGQLTFSEPATYYFAVDPESAAPPTAIDDSYGVTPGNVLRGNVLLNDDAGESGGPLTAAVETGPTAGTLVLNSNGTFNYTPGAAFTGTDTFTYRTTGPEGSDVASVTITGRPTEPTFQAILSEGHTDIGIAYESDAFDPHIHDEETDTEYASDEALLQAGPATQTTRPAGAAFDFIGVPAGQTIWVLPQIEEVGKLFLGIGSEEIPPADFTGDLTLQVLAVDGPGFFSMWQSDAFGNPIVLAATSDGVTAGDAITLPAGSHMHQNFGFTARGLYAVTLQFSGTPSSGANAGQLTFSEPATYYFAVDPENAAPVVLGPTSAQVSINGTFAFTGTNTISVSDAEMSPGDYTAVVTATNGTVSLAGGTAGTTATVTGTLAEVNAALAGLVFTPTAEFIGAGSVKIDVTDPGYLVGAENAKTGTLTIPVNITRNTSILAVGGSDGTVRILDSQTGEEVSLLRPLDFSTDGVRYTGLVQVALGDLNGDGVPELFVAAANPLGVEGLDITKSGKVFVFDGSSLAQGLIPSVIHTFTPFVSSSGPGGNTTAYINGLNIAVGDVNGDGKLDLVAGTRGIVANGGIAEYGRLVVMNAGNAANGSADKRIGAITTPFGPGYQKGVVVALGNLDGVGGDEIAVTRGGPVVQSNPNKSVKLKVFKHNGFGLSELDLNGAASGAFAPFPTITRDSRITFTDADGDGKHELVFSALDRSNSLNTRIRIAVFSVNTENGLASLVSTGSGPSNSYVIGTNVRDHAIGHVDLDNDGSRDLAVLTESALPGIIQYLDPNTGAILPGGFGLNIATGGVSIDGF